MAGRRTRGRQRIEIRQIENEDDKLITFSKRRSGIYKKASELVTLCGSDLAVVIFSPAGKPYSFSHPSVNSTASRFLDQNPPHSDAIGTLVESNRRLRTNELNKQHDKLVEQVEAEKARGKVLKQVTDGRNGEGWWEAPVQELNLEELDQMKVRMEELRRNLWSSINRRNQGARIIQGESSNQRNP